MTKLEQLGVENGDLLPEVELPAYLDAMAAAPLPRDISMVSRLICAEPTPEIETALIAEIGDRAAKTEADIENPAASPERLAALRAAIDSENLSGFLIGMADEYQNEYVPQRARRIAWLTGFTGSAGLIAVLKEKAAIFTDGRYTLQVRDQVDTELFETHHITDAPVTHWLAENLSDGDRLGYDPWLFTDVNVQRYSKALETIGAVLVPVYDNPLDKVWAGQPPAPLAMIQPHNLDFTGESADDKRTRLAAALKDEGLAAAVITSPDSIAWLLNIRGGDVSRSPLPLSFAILHDNGHCDLYVDRRKVTPELERHLGNQVGIHQQGDFETALSELATESEKIQVDMSVAAAAVVQRLNQGAGQIVDAPDPCKLAKACKNEVELNGIRRAHRRDGVAETKFLHWLATKAQGGDHDEIEAVEKLAEFRSKGEHFRDFSFDTISGSGPNGAIVHYRVTAKTNRNLQPGELYLVDSGAQYLDGTTDITRTVAIGTPSDEMRDRFTRVLKGHIALARVVFPEGTTGGALDILARQELWRAGLDYDHGTGHGVGAYLGVHEGPHSISKVYNKEPLQPGMIISNEPGYYKTGEYGIRIENLVAVREAGEIAGGERKMFCLETLTFAPIDLNLVDAAILNGDEIDWLNNYHHEVWDKISPDLVGDVKDWLQSATRAI